MNERRIHSKKYKEATPNTPGFCGERGGTYDLTQDIDLLYTLPTTAMTGNPLITPIYSKLYLHLSLCAPVTLLAKSI